ncbi:hypothetical protein BRC67_10290 [Halobacteriales archaeon QH_3_68_24]|jgi:hypothetical protein|nr:MAG: hypothetical protein BRC67_10290 [Halobacteriales archaeon QH_3_68_24]
MATGLVGRFVAALNARSIRLIGASILAGSTGVSAASVATDAGLAIPPEATATAAEYVGESGFLPDLVGFGLVHPVYPLAAFVGLALLVLGDRAPLT